MPDDVTVKRALESLVDRERDVETAANRADSDYRETIERAEAALSDLDAAAEFVEDIGLRELENAVEQAETDLSACASDGRAALAAFRRFRDVAEGGRE